MTRPSSEKVSSSAGWAREATRAVDTRLRRDSRARTSGTLLGRRRFVLAAASALVLPLMLLRQITSLRYSSLFALCSILYVVAVIAYYGATGPLATQEGPLLLWPDPGSDLL